MNKVKFPVVAVIAGVVLFLAVLATIGGNGASAAPSLIPTPVSVTARSASPAKAVVFYSGSTVTTAVASNAQGIAEYEIVDLQWIIDQTVLASGANTTTLKLQFSNDGVNWVDGATAVSSNAADAVDMQQYALFGQFVRVHTTLGNTNPVTITVLGIAK